MICCSFAFHVCLRLECDPVPFIISTIAGVVFFPHKLSLLLRPCACSLPQICFFFLILTLFSRVGAVSPRPSFWFSHGTFFFFPFRVNSARAPLTLRGAFSGLFSSSFASPLLKISFKLFPSPSSLPFFSWSAVLRGPRPLYLSWKNSPPFFARSPFSPPSAVLPFLQFVHGPPPCRDRAFFCLFFPFPSLCVVPKLSAFFSGLYRFHTCVTHIGQFTDIQGYSPFLTSPFHSHPLSPACFCPHHPPFSVNILPTAPSRFYLPPLYRPPFYAPTWPHFAPLLSRSFFFSPPLPRLFPLIHCGFPLSTIFSSLMTPTRAVFGKLVSFFHFFSIFSFTEDCIIFSHCPSGSPTIFTKVSFGSPC